LRQSASLLHNVLFLVALLLVALLGWQAQRTARAVLDSNEEIRQGLALITAVRGARSAMQDVETGTRGFVLTGQAPYLEPYEHGRREWREAFTVLRARLAGRDPPRDAWLADLEAAGAQRLEISRLAVAYRRTHGLEESARYNMTLGGKRAMDRIRALLDELEREERTRLDADAVAIDARYADARATLIRGGVFGAVLLLGSLFAINLNLVTRRRLAQRAQAQRAFLRHVVDADPSLVYVRADDGRIELCNVEFAETFGTTVGALEGRTPEEAGLSLPAAALFEGDRDIASGRRGEFSDEIALADPRGRTRWFQRMKAPLVLPGGASHALTVAVDITARREVERMKDEFVSTVSHELRTPLTSIRGSLGLLVSGMAGGIDPAAKPLLDIAHNSCERLVRLINDILDMEKLASGRLQLQRQPVRVDAAISQAVEQIAGYAAQHDVRVETEVEGVAWVDADPDRLAQVLANLLSNAIKHSPPGGVVRVDAKARAGAVAIGVRDHGRGIPAAFRPRVFERFAQADVSDAPQSGGTGHGLAITRSLVEEHGGTIGFADAPGGGTRFEFTLHAAAPPRTGTDVEPPTDAAGAPALLLVEDDAGSVREFEAILRGTGFRIVAVADGRSALDTMSREPVGAVLVSMALRGEDPLGFVRDLRSKPAYRHLPVIAIGAEDATGAAIGIGDWLRKPFDAGRVVAAVRACIDPGGAAHVLHVEDDEDLRAMVAGLLATERVALHGAGSLAEARAALAARHHALVILDLMLPDGDGAELLVELAATRPPTRVIIFSARDTPLPESTVILRRLVKSQHEGPELAALVQAQLHHWPRHDPPRGPPGGSA
jgi:PAS domain S-box-containing protein